MTTTATSNPAEASQTAETDRRALSWTRGTNPPEGTGEGNREAAKLDEGQPKDVAAANREAANYRTTLHAAEAERDRLAEVLRRHSNNFGAVQRVGRLTRHLAKRPVPKLSVTPRSTHQPTKLSRRLADETVAAIVDAYATGATTREVGARFGLAHSSVNKLLRQHSVVARRRSPTAAEMRRAAALYEAGESMRTIAEHLGFGASTIARALVSAGVPLRPRYTSQ